MSKNRTQRCITRIALMSAVASIALASGCVTIGRQTAYKKPRASTTVRPAEPAAATEDGVITSLAQADAPAQPNAAPPPTYTPASATSTSRPPTPQKVQPIAATPPETPPSRAIASTPTAPPSSTPARSLALDGPVGRAQLRERALQYLTTTATEGTPEERANALEGLIAAPNRLAPLLPEALASENPGVRGVAAMTVGKARLTTVAAHAAPLAHDPYALVRAGGIFAVARCGMGVDPTPLAAMLKDPDPAVRAQAAYVLGELGDRSALPMLREAAKAPIRRANPAIARLMDLQIAEARIKLGDDAALAEIRAALYPARPEDLEATALAAQIIGEVRDRASVDQLIYLTAVQDETKAQMPAEVRLAAAGSLAQLGLRKGSFIAHEYRTSERDTLRAQSAFVFGQTGLTENLPVLEAMLADPVGRVRVAAASAIVNITEIAAITQAEP